MGRRESRHRTERFRAEVFWLFVGVAFEDKDAFFVTWCFRVKAGSSRSRIVLVARRPFGITAISFDSMTSLSVGFFATGFLLSGTDFSATAFSFFGVASFTKRFGSAMFIRLPFDVSHTPAVRLLIDRLGLDDCDVVTGLYFVQISNLNV